MANEIELNATLAYSDDDETSDFLQVLGKFADVASKLVSKFNLSVTTAEIAIVSTGISGFGWMMIVNRDETNFVEVRIGTGSTKFAKLLPGEFCLFRRGSGLTAPYLIADTATCKVDVFLIAT